MRSHRLDAFAGSPAVDSGVLPRRPWLLLGVMLWAAACSSPNRGVWNGTFSGSVDGTVEFRINSRGTELTGTMDGQTADGTAFHADMKGGINDIDFYATFEGTAQTGFRPVPFEGFMRGQLGTGQARGDWECQLRFAQDKMRGDWAARQTEVR